MEKDMRAVLTKYFEAFLGARVLGYLHSNITRESVYNREGEIEMYKNDDKTDHPARVPLL